MWPDMAGRTLAGLGYATPFIRGLSRRAGRTLALMPGRQGAIAWPRDAAGCVTLVDDHALPLPDACIDRLVVVHGIESMDPLRPSLREIWRVLAPEGLVLVVVPNRRGLWAQFDGNPFGHGRPFSRSQLNHLLGEALFEPVRWQAALFAPPVSARLVLRTSNMWDRLGERWWSRFAGVHLVEARKRLYAPSGGVPVRAAQAVPVRVRPGAALAHRDGGNGDSLAPGQQEDALLPE